MATATLTNVSDVSTVVDAMEKGKINFNAEAVPLILANGTDVTTHKGIIRTDTGAILGINGIGYSIFQNTEAMSLMEVMLAEKTDIKLDSIISYDGGRKVQLTATTGHIKIGKDDLEKKVSIINSFDGSANFMATFWLKKLVCSNGLRAFVKESQVALRHSGDIQAKLKNAFHILQLSENHFDHFQAIANKLTEKIADRAMVDAFIAEMVGELGSTRQQNIAQDIEHLFQHGKGNEGKTAWDLYNGFTEYVDHYRGKDEGKRLASAMGGSGMNQKIHALDVLAKY